MYRLVYHRKSHFDPEAPAIYRSGVIHVLNKPKAEKLKSKLIEVFYGRVPLVLQWASTRNPYLGGEKPENLIFAGRFEEVLKALDEYM